MHFYSGSILSFWYFLWQLCMIYSSKKYPFFSDTAVLENPDFSLFSYCLLKYICPHLLLFYLWTNCSYRLIRRFLQHRSMNQFDYLHKSNVDIQHYYFLLSLKYEQALYTLFKLLNWRCDTYELMQSRTFFFPSILSYC